MSLRGRPFRLAPGQSCRRLPVWMRLHKSRDARGLTMTDKITLTLAGKEVEAAPGETLWQVAQRHGTTIPHLCWLPEPGYRADGNCRACLVEIEGEGVLVARCIRKPANGMKVVTGSARAQAARHMIFDLLASD